MSYYIFLYIIILMLSTSTQFMLLEQGRRTSVLVQLNLNGICSTVFDFNNDRTSNGSSCLSEELKNM